MCESLLAPIFRIDATVMLNLRTLNSVFRFHSASTDVVLSSFGITASYLSQNAVCDLRAARSIDAGESPLAFARYGHAVQDKYILEDKVPKRFPILREFLDLRRVNELVPSDRLFRTDLTARRPFRCTPFKSSGKPLARLIAIISKQVFLPRL